MFYISKLSIAGLIQNQLALFGNMTMVQHENGDTQVGMNYLHGWGLEFVAAAKFAIEIGLFAIQLFELTLQEGEETHCYTARADFISRPTSSP
ncbi:hypothetical protein ACTMU2_14400 [Cupriavidus basilensis]